jgi:hypothetical protein
MLLVTGKSNLTYLNPFNLSSSAFELEIYHKAKNGCPLLANQSCLVLAKAARSKNLYLPIADNLCCIIGQLLHFLSIKLGFWFEASKMTSIHPGIALRHQFYAKALQHFALQVRLLSQLPFPCTSFGRV